MLPVQTAFLCELGVRFMWVRLKYYITCGYGGAEIVKVREDANQPLKEDFEKSFEDDALGHLVVEKQEDRIQLSMQEYPNFSLWDAIRGLDFWYPTSSDPMKQHFQKVILKGKWALVVFIRSLT